MPQPRPSRRRRLWRTWALGSSLSVVLAVLTVASAAQLPISGGDYTLDSKVPCTTATLSATATGTPSGGNYTQVRISSIPSNCNNLPVRLVVYGNGGTQLATDTGTGNTGATGTATITTGSFTGANVLGVALLVNTWGVPTSWTPPVVIPPLDCRVINNGGSIVNNETCTATPGSLSVYGGNDYAYFQITVTHQSGSWPSNRGWRVTIHFDNTWFPWRPVYVKRTAGASVRYGSCGTEPYTTVTVQTPANAGSGNKWGSVFFIAHWTNPPPGTDPAGVVICS